MAMYMLLAVGTVSAVTQPPSTTPNLTPTAQLAAGAPTPTPCQMVLTPSPPWWPTAMYMRLVAATTQFIKTPSTTPNLTPTGQLAAGAPTPTPCQPLAPSTSL